MAPSHKEMEKRLDDRWGSIVKVVHERPIDVKGDETWFSVICMWLTIPLSLLQAIFGGLCQSVFVCYSIGTCCIPCSERLCSVWGSVSHGRRLYMAWVWWRYVLSGLIALVSNGGSRLALFIWEWRAFGGGEAWYHGAGYWLWSYKACDEIMQSQQIRGPDFGCMNAPIPDLFATDLLIFLSNDGPQSQWAYIRGAVHKYFLDMGSQVYDSRVADLPSKIAADWPNAQLSDMNDTSLGQRLV